MDDEFVNDLLVGKAEDKLSLVARLIAVPGSQLLDKLPAWYGGDNSGANRVAA